MKCVQSDMMETHLPIKWDRFCNVVEISRKTCPQQPPEMSHHLLLPFIKHPFVAARAFLCIAKSTSLFWSEQWPTNELLKQSLDVSHEIQHFRS